MKKINFHLLACLLWAVAFCFPENLGAVTKTWVGGNGNWSVATNWSPSGMPTAADDVVINSGTATLDVSTTIASLAMGGSGGLVGTNDLSVSGDFTLTSYGFNLGGTLTVNGNFFFGVVIIGNGIVGGTMIINGMTNITDPAWGGHWIRKKTFFSNGGILWTGGNIGVTDGGIWKLAAGATFTEQNTDGNTHLLYDNFGGGGTFENNGTFIRNGTAPLAIGGGINGQNFDNFGTIVGQSAQFGFSGSGVFTNKPSGIIAGTKKISFGGGFSNLGTIAPGYNSIGTLPLDRPAGIPISTLNIEIAAPGSVDKLEITGNVDLAGATLNVTETPCLPNGNYTFLTWTGTRTGNFGTLNLPPGYSVTYNDALKKAELVYLDPPPTIACPANTTLNTSPGLCEATSPAIGSATVQDNCPDATSTNNAPASLLVGTSTVIWTATDSKGSTATCLQTVEIQDVEVPTVTCPANVSANADAGFCSMTLPISAATAADNCAISTNLNDAPAIFPVGTTTVTHTATDIHGNTSVCAQTVTVNDAENPSITCPADLTVTATPGICTASPTLGSATATDNCTGVGTSNDAPTSFAIGTNTVTWTATDAAGGTAICAQTVIVLAPSDPETCNGLDDDCDGVIDEPLAVVLTSQTNISCGNTPTGAANITPSCGLVPYTFLWSNGTTSEDLMGVLPGTYTVTVTDNQGLTQTLSVEILQTSGGIALTYSMTKPTCFGGSNGTVQANPTAPVSGYTYQWSTGATTRKITGIPAGDYTVTVTKTSTGCTAVGTTTLGNPAPIAITLKTVNNPCFGNTLGSLTASSTGGTGSKTYLWSTAATGPKILNLAAGTYTVTATDSKGCTNLASATLVDPPVLGLTHTLVPVPGGKFKVTLTGTGGTPAYKYCRLSGTTCGFGSSAIFTNLLANTTYTFRVRDAKLCVAEIMVTTPASLSTPSDLRASQKLSSLPEADIILSPNPTSGPVSLQTEADIQRIALRDPLGRLVREANGSMLNGMDLTGLPAGLYLLEVSVEGEAATRVLKVVKE